MAKAKRVYGVEDIQRYNPKTMPFEGRWFDSFGTPEYGGCWLIWGRSGSGKTRFVAMLCKYLTQFGNVDYNSIEEGLSFSFKKAIVAVGMEEVRRRFKLLHKMSIAELRERLKKQKSAHFIVIDSIQYSGLNKDTAKALVDEFPKKTFIFISHAEGKNPQGRTATAIQYHANVKIFVEAYRIVKPVSRFKDGECQPFTIWEEGARRYWEGKE